MTTIPLLTVAGDAYACGFAHGQRFAREITDNIETYLRRFAGSGLGREQALAEARRWYEAIGAESASYAQEMQGIAEGAGQDEFAISLLNARYELAFTLFGQEASKKRDEALLNAVTDGCTTFGLTPQATADRHNWLGQNWDWLEGVHGRTFVLEARRKDKPSFICLTEAGIAGGKMGVNECGVGLVENGLASSHDGRNPYRKPFHVRCRDVLDSDHLDGAVQMLTGTARTCSANFIIGQAGHSIVDIETSPDHASHLHPRDGMITHSNHFLAAGHGESLLERISPHTLPRVERMRALLEPHLGRLSFEHMRTAMSDHVGAPFAICRHPDPTEPPAKRTMTAGAVLIDLDQRVMYAANGPPCGNEYVAFRV
jgi:isopenicillin-N N-acyltransferase-like protein